MRCKIIYFLSIPGFYGKWLLILACIKVAVANDCTAVADSSLYMELRRQEAIKGAPNTLLETADALADARLYTEAIEIIGTFLETASSHEPEEKTKPDKSIDRKWRISSGVDYYRLEDIDTATMTREEYQDYRRLTQTPLSFWGRAKYMVAFDHGLVEQIAPEVYVSNYRSSFELPARFNLENNRISMETAAKADKWFQADATGPMRFRPAQDYPSDMAGLYARISAERYATENRGWSWEIPVLVDWEHYRQDRTGYESFAEYRFNPALEYRRGGPVSFSFRFAGDLQYENYYRSAPDTFDVVRGMLVFDNSIRTGNWYLRPMMEWQTEWYFNAGSPGRIDRGKTVFWVERRSGKNFSPRLVGSILHDRECYYRPGNSVLSATETRISPTLRIKMSKAAYLEAELLYERRWADVFDNDYVWPAHRRFESRLRSAGSFEWFDGSVSVGWRKEDVDRQFERFIRDGRSLLLGTDVAVSIWKHVSLNLLLDYEYSKYAPWGAYGRRTENLMASGNFSVSW